VTPHHLLLTDELAATYDPRYKVNPPLRTKADVEALRQAVADGTIDAIATDHAPHSFDEKEVEYVAAPFGIVGLETAIGLAITELLMKGVLSLGQLVKAFSVNPRRLLGLPAISIKEGAMANLTIFDPASQWVVEPQKFHSRSKNTPFGGMKLTGKAVGVLNNGQEYWNG